MMLRSYNAESMAGSSVGNLLNGAESVLEVHGNPMPPPDRDMENVGHSSWRFWIATLSTCETTATSKIQEIRKQSSEPSARRILAFRKSKAHKYDFECSVSLEQPTRMIKDPLGQWKQISE